MYSLNSLNPRRGRVSCSAELLNSPSRIVRMRRMPFLWSIAVVLSALSFAGCSGYSSNGTVNGGGPIAPYINTQPANQTVAAGQTATFNVVAAWTPPLTYQWQKNRADITGATSSSYTTRDTTTSDTDELFAIIRRHATASHTSQTPTINS